MERWKVATIYLNPKQKGSFDISWDPLDHKGYQKYEISTECSTI
ncbi:MAG: hypothetical protein AABX47_08325 [Nanoarchaeota archaeon]